MWKDMGWWESNGNILIHTPQLEIFFLLFSFKPPFQLTFTSSAVWFSLLLPHNLVSDICQTFCTSSGRHLYLCACVYRCVFVREWLSGLFYFVCVGYEKIKLGEGQLASIQTLLDLSVSHNHAHIRTPTQGIRCKVPQFKVWHKHYQVLYPHLKWDENQKSRLPRLSVALWGGSPHMFIRSVLTCLVNHIAEDCCESLGGLSHMSGHTWVRIQQIYCTLETAHKLCFY